MKIRSVRAHPFGPVADDELSFGPGFTVVHGPNESGKSSWHVATTTALTGQRKGRPRKAEKLFADRHRPWQHDGWAVSCVLDLDDGRSVRLLHNLARGTAQAIDEVTGADITEEFDNAGSVDAAQLIGLDRDTLPLVGSVRQAEILQLAAASASDDNVSALRGFLQQSVSSRVATDSTAEVALDRLSRFAAEAIGTEKRGSAKPLRQAREALERAEAEVTHCTTAWNAHHQLQIELDTVEDQGRLIEAQVLQARLAVAERSLVDAKDELAAALALSAEAPAANTMLPEPADLDAVREALVIYERQAAGNTDGRPRGVVRRPGGSSAHDRNGVAAEQPVSSLRAELAALPMAPTGDLEPRRDLVELQAAVRASSATLAAHDAARPASRDESADRSVDADQLRSMALELETELPPNPANVGSPYASPENDAPTSVGARLLVAAGLALCLIALALTVIGGSLSSLVFALFGLGAVAAIAGGIMLVQAQQPSAEAIATQAHHQAELRLATATWQDAHTRRSAVLAELSRQQLPSDAEGLRSLALRSDRAAAEADAQVKWRQRRQHLATQAAAETQRLAEQLAALACGVALTRGALDTDAVLDAADRYFDDCLDRAAQARLAAQRPALEAQLQALVDREDRQAAAKRETQAAESSLRTAALQAGIPADGAEIAIVAGQVRDWLNGQRAELAAAQQAREAAAQLDGLLAGRTFADLEQATVTAADQVEAARRVVESHDSNAPAAGSIGESGLRRLESKAAVHADRASELRGRLAEAESSLEPLAQVLERQQRAGAAYERLQRLDGLVRHTSLFLEQAREHLHRDIAPGITDATKHRLATVSAGRYKEIRVNPDDLSVQVQLPDGDWRLAERLSHGTAEQVYLLVRAAIAEIVAPDVESCPLILDDVTVHADRERTIAMLETLDELSRDRQVILFSQELDVIEWAEEVGANVIRLPAA